MHLLRVLKIAICILQAFLHVDRLLLCLLFLLTKTMKSKGLIALEAHIEKPEESPIFKRYPKVRVSVLKRICQGLFVIDQEEAEGMGPEPFTVTAIYETWHGKIVCVWFIQR